ncbi:MAG: hypothetical protein MZV63_18035 [Marinilabiliales bacterium]|nr:hypothetical protein [Marinilabiliales bacterium]
MALLNALTGPVKQAEQLLFLAEKGFELGVKIAPRGAGRRAERHDGAGQPGRRPARLPAGARQPRLGGRRPRRRRAGAHRPR